VIDELARHFERRRSPGSDTSRAGADPGAAWGPG
jgi:hypothetical protein